MGGGRSPIVAPPAGGSATPARSPSAGHGGSATPARSPKATQHGRSKLDSYRRARGQGASYAGAPVTPIARPRLHLNSPTLRDLPPHLSAILSARLDRYPPDFARRLCSAVSPEKPAWPREVDKENSRPKGAVPGDVQSFFLSSVLSHSDAGDTSGETAADVSAAPPPLDAWREVLRNQAQAAQLSRVLTQRLEGFGARCLEAREGCRGSPSVALLSETVEALAGQIGGLRSVAEQLEVVEADLDGCLRQLGGPAQLDPQSGGKPAHRGGGGSWITCGDLARLQAHSMTLESRELQSKVTRLEAKVLMYQKQIQRMHVAELATAASDSGERTATLSHDAPGSELANLKATRRKLEEKEELISILRATVQEQQDELEQRDAAKNGRSGERFAVADESDEAGPRDQPDEAHHEEETCREQEYDSAGSTRARLQVGAAELESQTTPLPPRGLMTAVAAGRTDDERRGGARGSASPKVGLRQLQPTSEPCPHSLTPQFLCVRPDRGTRRGPVRRQQGVGDARRIGISQLVHEAPRRQPRGGTLARPASCFRPTRANRRESRPR